MFHLSACAGTQANREKKYEQGQGTGSGYGQDVDSTGMQSQLPLDQNEISKVAQFAAGLDLCDQRL